MIHKLIIGIMLLALSFAMPATAEEKQNPKNEGKTTANDEAIEKIARQEKMSVTEVKKILEIGCDSGNTSQMTQCGRFRFMIADIELNNVYNQVIKQLTTQSARSKLKKAQLAWIAFRDSVCAYESEGWTGGSGYGMVYVSCMQKYAEERIGHLREYLDCKDPGCPGK